MSKKIVEIYHEYDGWRIEVYHGDKPQCVDDEIISKDTNASDDELIELAKKRVKERGLNHDKYKFAVVRVRALSRKT